MLVWDFDFFLSSRRRHTTSVSAFLLNRSSDLWLLNALLRILIANILKRAFSSQLAAKLRNRLLRSEERRVGKECRSRGWPYQSKKNNSRQRGTRAQNSAAQA